MKVYKFGGASVRSAEGIRNIANIVSLAGDDLFIVVSAMGKTTNALELVLDSFMKADKITALERLNEVAKYHFEIVDALFPASDKARAEVSVLFSEIETIITERAGDDYDRWYDHLVSYGEVISTKIVSLYLHSYGIKNQWLDMRKLLVTDSNFREANVRMDESGTRLRAIVNFNDTKVFIGQGFIGANLKGDPTTLGREGSDYTAAVVGNLLEAESVSIWKDVPGILNADPRIFNKTVLIPELTYFDAVELAFSGAQVIHPKTIKPLENKNIPLYVRPFGNPTEPGSVIKAAIEHPISIPILILRQHQILVTVRPRDFSFVLEESLTKLFTIMNKHRLKVSLIQSSAVSISVCVDQSRYFASALDELSNEFRVNYNENLELLTIRAKNDAIIRETTEGRTILLSQHTRRNVRFLMKEE